MRLRYLLLLHLFALSISSMEGRIGHYIVADSLSHSPLAGASAFDGKGNGLGMTDASGRLPYLHRSDFPITLRYLGYAERQVNELTSDTIFLSETPMALPEVIVDSRKHSAMHLLAYVREYSSLTSYTDTIFLFREKMVDFMVPPAKKENFRGWLSPRVLKSKSYYRFTNADGLDSVSSFCRHHFSWSDWVGIPKAPSLPSRIKTRVHASDTLRGKYSPTEIWRRAAERVSVDVDVLADTASRKWVPTVSNFFDRHTDFESFRLRYNYDNITEDTLHIADLTGYSFNIDSKGRGFNMFRFNRKDEPCYVSTFAEVYILDKEYITASEASQWEKRKFDADGLEIIEPAEAPELQPYIRNLVARVNAIDPERVRLGFTPDQRLVGRNVIRTRTFTQKALAFLKKAIGLAR